MFNRNTSIALIAFLGIVGCASQPSNDQKSEAKLVEKIKAEAPADTPEAIADRGAQSFINAPGLTPDQKQRIMAVYVRTYNDAIQIRKDIGQSKSLLFKTIATKKIGSKEVESLRKHIVDLDHKRLEVMFKALKDVQEIVGTGDEKEEIYKHFYDFEYPGKMVTSR
jgi:hypothetical protein